MSARIWICLLALGAAAMAAEIDVSFKTKDGVTIKGTLFYPDKQQEKGAKRPAVVLIHQAGSTRLEWTGTARKMLGPEYRFVVLAYDVRGHGRSGKGRKGNLFSDPTQAPEDLKAALAFLRAHPRVDNDRIGVVGSSIGGNLACVASAEYGIKTAVAISCKTDAVLALAGKKELSFQSLFLVSSENDQAGKRAAWAKELFAMAKEPRRVEIVKGSRAHGVSVFRDDAKLEGQILEWVKARLKK